MAPKRKKPDPEAMARILAEARGGKAARDKGYRERALALFPNVCGRCGREFSGKTLRELTVHHKDHNHDNNPPDGSNWELLCVYCHDNEHQDAPSSGLHGGTTMLRHEESSMGHNPFAGLKDLIPPEDEKK